MTPTYLVHKCLVVAFTLFVLLISLGMLAHAGAAQPQPDSVNATEQADDRCAEHINQDVAICETAIENGHAVVTLDLDRSMSITLTEVSDTTGHLSRETYSLPEGESEIRLSLSQGAEHAGVTIDDGTDLYLKMIDQDSQLIGPPWGPTDAQLAAIGAALSVSFVVIFLVWRVLRGDHYNPQRIA